MVDALSNQSMPDQMYEILMRKILTGVFAPGDRIVESRIARDHGISQGPVREALRQLAAVGLIENIPRRGAVVRSVRTEDFEPLVPVRARLEATAARLIASGGDVSTLMTHVDGMKTAANLADHQRHYQESFEFHRAVSEGSGNAQVLWLFDCMAFQARLQFTLNIPKTMTKRELLRNAESHRELAALIASGDPDVAEAAMYAHCMSYAEDPTAGDRLWPGAQAPQ